VSYNYQAEREKLFTEDGQRMFLKFRDTTNRLLQEAGAARMDKMIAGLTGDIWLMLACADWMVELGEIVEISPPNSAGQHRVFLKYNS
jgi:hypothetical protein